VPRLLTLLGITLLTFSLTHLIPADPARTLAGPKADRGTVERIRREMDLDAPVPVQYARYLGRLLHGDLGRSYLTRQSVLEAILERLPATAFLAGASLAAALVIGLAAGLWAAAGAGGVGEAVVLAASTLLLSLPVFWLGLMLLYVFGFTLRLLPLGGFSSAVDVVLPASALGLATGAYYARVLHANLLVALGSDYVRTARAKGIAPLQVYAKHALRNALLPFVSLAALDLAGLLGGVALTETVFNWPGLGRLAVEAVFNQDIPMVMGVVLFSAALVVVVNAAVDVGYRLIDPRIRG
jgi:ABC-type dipeptide/oligopeptide/nickel transport system permease component